ncbi:unnamed protein product [Musa textilis]
MRGPKRVKFRVMNVLVGIWISIALGGKFEEVAVFQKPLQTAMLMAEAVFLKNQKHHSRVLLQFCKDLPQMSTTFHYQAAPRRSSPLLVAASGDDVSGGAAVGSNERFGCRLASVLMLFSSSFFLFGSGRPEPVNPRLAIKN